MFSYHPGAPLLPGAPNLYVGARVLSALQLLSRSRLRFFARLLEQPTYWSSESTCWAPWSTPTSCTRLDTCADVCSQRISQVVGSALAGLRYLGTHGRVMATVCRQVATVRRIAPGTPLLYTVRHPSLRLGS